MAFLFGHNRVMQALAERASFIAQSGLPVLIEGESGVGKEALAQHLHLLSGRAGDFVRLLCRAGGPLGRGPGPSGGGPGQWEALQRSVGGTLFLKDIHLLSVGAQGELLTTLEELLMDGDRERNGAPEFRLISSASEALEGLVVQQRFLAPLYYRLSVYRIWLPPLRERPDDVLDLFDCLLRQAAQPGSPVVRPAPRLRDAIAIYRWPGNLRELFNVAQMYRLAPDADEIVAEIRRRSRAPQLGDGVDAAWPSLKEQVRGASRQLEQQIILRTLQQHRWNRRRTAQTLKISYRSLLYKMKNCNLRLESQPSREGLE